MNRSQLRAELRPEDVTAVKDSREQLPLDLSPLRTVTGTLTTGDYGLLHLPQAAAIERKSLDDLLSVVGTERERFERELDRLRAYPCRALLIESTWATIEMGQWSRSRLKPQQVLGSLLAWIEMGIPVVMCTNHTRAGQYAARLLYCCARRRYRELRGMLGDFANCTDANQDNCIDAGQEVNA
jgi:ERCC4-type nuclease